jgi:hypothetical protein
MTAFQEADTVSGQPKKSIPKRTREAMKVKRKKILSGDAGYAEGSAKVRQSGPRPPGKSYSKVGRDKIRALPIVFTTRRRLSTC